MMYYQNKLPYEKIKLVMSHHKKAGWKIKM